MKILTVTDLFVNKVIVEKELKKNLQEFKDLEIINLETDFPITQLLFGEEVSEFNGSEEMIIDKIEDIDYLVIHTAPVTRRILEKANKLKGIFVMRGGCINVNTEAATNKKIPVFNTPGRNCSAVAEFTVGIMIAETRNICRGHENLKKGKWIPDYYIYEQSEHELSSKTIGLVGFGNIGKKISNLLCAFGSKILVYDPYIAEKTKKDYNVSFVDFDELITLSDIVSVHTRVTKETAGMFNKDVFKKMKSSAIFVNTARGPLVNYEDLYEALTTGEISRAALDNFEVEPIEEDNPLLKLNNITITPHIAGSSRDAAEFSAKVAAQDLKDFILKKPVNNCINKETIV